MMEDFYGGLDVVQLADHDFMVYASSFDTTYDLCVGATQSDDCLKQVELYQHAVLEWDKTGK